MQKIYEIDYKISCLNCVKCKDMVGGDAFCTRLSEAITVCAGHEICEYWKPWVTDIRLHIEQAKQKET